MIVGGNSYPYGPLFKFFTCEFQGKIIELIESNDYNFIKLQLSNKDVGNQSEYFTEGLSDTVLHLKLKKESTSTIHFGELVRTENIGYSSGELIEGVKWKYNGEIINNTEFLSNEVKDGENINNTGFLSNEIQRCESQEYYNSVIGALIIVGCIILGLLAFIITKSLKKKK